MEKILKAKSKKEVIRPLDKLELKEGEEIKVAISTLSETEENPRGNQVNSTSLERLIVKIY